MTPTSDALTPEECRAINVDCTHLIHSFYRCLDEHRYDELASLFAENGTWVRLGTELVGPEAIRNVVGERGSWLTAHVVTNVLIDVIDTQRAESTQYVTLYRHEDWDPADGPAPVVLPLGILRHRDTLVLEAGIWKFGRKTSRAVMVDRSRVTHYDNERSS